MMRLSTMRLSTPEVPVRGTPPRVPRRRRLPRMKRFFTKDEIASFKKTLLDHRRALAGDVNHMENSALRNPKENAATLDISNFADLGTDYHEQELTLGLIENSEGTLHAIDDAIQRIEDGTYGVCEGSDPDKPHAVGRPRLKALPWARYCIECQRKAELGIEE
jgi:DnaK suppressor protein